jgi:hypothetical protein
MTQIPYNPMRKAEKYVTQEDMWTTLARHLSPNVQVQLPQEVPTPKAELRWLEPVRTGRLSGYVLTACGRYSISKDIGQGDAVTYTAWKRLPDLERHGKPWKQMPVNLGCALTRAEAEQLCTKDNS